MGGTSCHYSSSDPQSNGCTSIGNDGILSAGAIAGLVIGSLLGIALLIFLGILIYRLSKGHPIPPQRPPPHAYNVPRNTDHYYHHRQPMERSDMHTPSKPPAYYETPINSDRSPYA